jgi:cytochrome c-type biogenesis protein CcmH/NrfG
MLLPAEVRVILRSTKVDRPNNVTTTVRRAPRLLLTIALLATTASILPAQIAPTQRTGSGGVLVRVVGDNNQPIDTPARVIIWPEGDMSRELQATSNNGSAQFARLVGGRYTVEVDIPGFKKGTGETYVMDFGTVDVSVHMETDDPSAGPGAKGMLLAPKARKELDAGLAEMRASKYPEAEKHFEAAYKLAPGNPEVNNMLGKLYLFTKDFDKSQDFFSRAASLDPANVTALLGIGQLRILQLNFDASIEPLEKAVQLAPQNSFAHWLLGVGYLDTKKSEKARQQATEAIKFSKSPSEAEYLLGEALYALGRNAEALAAFQTFVHDLPNDFFVPAAQKTIAKLQASPAALATQPNDPPQN